MTVGSNEFYLAYAATHPGVYDLLDLGHFHPTENVADKLSALLLFFDKVPLHVTRPVRWDSDHVVLFDDPTKDCLLYTSVKGMLPKNTLGRAMGKKLKVYVGAEHPHAAQQPRKIDLEG